MKKILTDYMCSALLAAILGLVLLIWPSLSNTILCYGIAGAFIVYGLFRIVCYFSVGALDTILRRDLAAGLIAIAIGIFFLAKPQIIVSILPVLFALALIAGAMGSIQTAFDMKRMKTHGWFASLIAAVVFIALGLVILLHSFSAAMVMTRFIGISLLIEGLYGFISAVVLGKKKKVFYVDGTVTDA